MTNVQLREELMKTMKKRRIEVELNQTELAKATSSSQKQISCYEHNIQVPTVGKFIAMCEALGLEVVLRTIEDKKEIFGSGVSN